MNPLVLMPQIYGKHLKLYIVVSSRSVGCLLAQDNGNGHEHAIYYLSKTLSCTEFHYSDIEKLCFALYYSSLKLRHYMLPFEVDVIAQIDLIKYMLTRPILKGRLGKWVLALSEYSLNYVPQNTVKGQSIADFLTDHRNLI